MSDFYELVSIVDGVHDEVTDGTIQKNGFNDTAIQREQRVGFDEKGPKYTNDMQSLLTVFMDVCGMLIKVQFTVQSDAKVFDTVHYLHWLVVDV